MDCFAHQNSSPFGTTVQVCPSGECPDPKKYVTPGSGHCFWDEALFDCLHDFSNSSYYTNNSNRSSSSRKSNNNTFNDRSESESHSIFPSSTVDDTSYVFDNNCFLNTGCTNNNRGGLTTASTLPSTIAPDYNISNDNIHVIGADDDEELGGHAALHYTDIEEAGPPARPQEFPIPNVHEGIRTMIRAIDHRTHEARDVKNVLLSASAAAISVNHAGGGAHEHDPPFLWKPVDQRAYLLKKKIAKNKFGSVYLSVVLKRRIPSPNRSFDNEEKEKHPEDDWDYNHIEWESTDEFVTVTVCPWSRAMKTHRASLSRKREGVVHAIAAMQHVGNYHPNVISLIGAFQDAEHLYMVTAFHGGTDLQSKVIAGREKGQYIPNENHARIIFLQLLQGLFHLQRKGVCHSNLSLENVYVNPTNGQNLVIDDLGRCMRVAYNDPSNFGCIIGEADGTTRRLLKLLPEDFHSHPPENLMYLPPEILENENAFDGFAADLWASGCILFVLLVGMAPFKTAHYWDAAYAEIASGNLKGLLSSLQINLSEEATGLLQNMFWRDPRDRLTLAQIMCHPWVKNQRLFKQHVSTLSGILPRNVSETNLSTVETASTTSSFANDKPTKSEKSRRSSGSNRKSLTKAFTGIFRGGKNSDNENGNDNKMSGSVTKVLGGSLSPSSTRSSHSCGSQKSRQRTSLGGLSVAASSVTAGSPGSLKAMSDVDDKESSSCAFQILQLPKL